MTDNVKEIDALPALKHKKRVAAYCRVSMLKDTMLHSLSTQVNEYRNQINSNDDWTFAGVYADEPISGTLVDREEFNDMVDAACDGKIDLILTKSISRFARNTKVLLTTLDKLKSHGVDVYFEEQNLHSMSGECEMLITIMGACAQEEARSMSLNMRTRIIHDFENGIIWGSGDTYGYTLADKKFTIVPEEAEVVKQIFEWYISGSGFTQIAERLTKAGVKTKTGKTRWEKNSVRTIIDNYNYTGNLILQKTFRDDYKTKKSRINRGQLKKWLVEQDHEAIIDEDTFMEAQRIRNLRIEEFTKPRENGAAVVYPFTGLIKCACCGGVFIHKITPYRTSWQCNTYSLYGTARCHSRKLHEQSLIETTKATLGLDEITREALTNLVKEITAERDGTLTYILMDGTKKVAYCRQKSRRESWTPEMRAKAAEKTRQRYMEGKKDESKS